MSRYIFAAFLMVQILMPLALVESSDFSTRIEYKQLNSVPKELEINLLPFKLIGLKYYYIGTKELNWYQAAQECRLLGGNLINLATEEERQLIGLNLDKGHKYWTDLSNLGQDEFYSIATGSKAIYEDWVDNDTNDKSKKCGSLEFYEVDGFLMKKAECSEKATYICQIFSTRTISMAIW